MNPPSLADVTLTLMEHCSTLELSVFAVVLRLELQKPILSMLHWLHSIHYIGGRSTNVFSNILHTVQEKEWPISECQNGPSFEYQLVIILITGKKNYKKINSINIYCE